jgi:hypothetical protein
MSVDTTPSAPAAQPMDLVTAAESFDFGLGFYQAAGLVMTFWAQAARTWSDAWLALMADGPFIGAAEAAAKLAWAGPQLWTEVCADHLRGAGLRTPLLADA